MKKKPKVRRAIGLRGIDKVLELSKVNAIHKLATDHEFIFLEKIKGEENWRLTYTESTIPDIQKLTSMEIIRDEKEKDTH